LIHFYKRKYLVVIKISIIKRYTTAIIDTLD